jgi:class 3 adenylate cyclase/CHASE2 domain-containing sensor protein
VRAKLSKYIPLWIILLVIAAGCAAEISHIRFLENLESMSYDIRVRYAANFQQAPGAEDSNVFWRLARKAVQYAEHTNATSLGFIAIDDQTIESINNGLLGERFGLYWPRHIYGRALDELTAEGAQAVAFDVIFSERRFDHKPVVLTNGETIGSDEFFARALRQSGCTVLAADGGLMPARLFRSNAWAIAHVSAQRDPDGILRRERPFIDFPIWNRYIELAAAEFGFDLSRTLLRPGQITFIRQRGAPVTMPLNQDGTLPVSEFDASPPPGTPATFVPIQTNRVWSAGIVMAARQLGLDLEHAQIGTSRILLRGTNGITRTLPLDAGGNCLINWTIPIESPILEKGALWELLQCQMERAEGTLPPAPDRWKGRLGFIGSNATGNDLSDMGATPLKKDTYLVAKHWNMANAVLTGQFITTPPLWVKLALIALMGALGGWATWTPRALTGSLLVLFSVIAYLFGALVLYVLYRWWIPVILPIVFALIITHALSLIHRIRQEQQEHKHIKNVFTKMLSPNIVNELLNAGDLSTLKGMRRELTVFFADIRGFTELTDTLQSRAEEHVRTHHLPPAEAEAYYDRQARELLEMVTQCLGLIAQTIKQHNGTLDKYIGDCVMAFWGAPTPDPLHALHCVQAAIDAQRSLSRLNEQRATQNRLIEEENTVHRQQGQPTRPLLPLISLGTGINTGQSIAGLMGSGDQDNYTVFGREINLASRLEGLSGHSRIVIGENTYLSLKRDAPELAARCIEQPKVKVKGFHNEVKSYEVPWKD